jgi:hypothetical protein
MNLMMIFVNNYHPLIHVSDRINGLFFFIIYFINFSLLFFRYLEAGQVDLAEKEKGRIEEAQRSRSAKPSNPTWFKPAGDSYVLVRDEDPSHSYWKKREDHWTGVEFIPLW